MMRHLKMPPPLQAFFSFFLANLHFLKWRHFWSNQHPFFSFFFSTLHMAALIASYPPPSLICGIHWSNKRWRLLLLYSQIILLLLVKEEISSFENVEIIKKLFCKYVILKTLNWRIFSFWLSFPRKKIGLLQAEAASWRRRRRRRAYPTSCVPTLPQATSDQVFLEGKYYVVVVFAFPSFPSFSREAEREAKIGGGEEEEASSCCTSSSCLVLLLLITQRRAKAAGFKYSIAFFSPRLFGKYLVRRRSLC